MAFLHQLISSCFDHFTQFVVGGGGVCLHGHHMCGAAHVMQKRPAGLLGLES